MHNMHRMWQLGVTLFLGMLGIAHAAEPFYVPGEILVKYYSGSKRTKSDMKRFYDSLRVKEVHYYSGELAGLEHLILEKGTDVPKALQKVRKSRLVEYAHPNYIVSVPEEPIRRSMRRDELHADSKGRWPCLFPGVLWPKGCWLWWRGFIPKRPPIQEAPLEIIPLQPDPELSQAWGVQKVGADQTWKVQPGSKEIIVAIIDSGIDYNHEDLAFNIWHNPDPTREDKIGWDFVHGDSLPYDDNTHGHGTHVAGTIGAVGGNGKAISGVAQRVSIMALKFLNRRGSGAISDGIAAIGYAIENGAQILSNSWGAPVRARALEDAIQKVQDAGRLFIAAAGNETKDIDDPKDADYPAAYSQDAIISVVATDSNDQIAEFSNFGVTNTDLAAPGTYIYSTAPDNNYRYLSGTSMATPHVAGAAALVWSQNPHWDFRQVKQALLDNVDAVPGLKGKTLSGGRLNVAKALGIVPLPPPAVPIQVPNQTRTPIL